MSTRADYRFLWVDVPVLLAILIVGWALVRLARTEPKLAQAGRESQELRTVFDESRELIRETMNSPEPTRRRSDLEWQETLLLEDEYLNISERVQAELPRLIETLDESPKPKETAQTLRKAQQDLKVWIQTQKDGVGLERLEQRSKELKQQITQADISTTNGPIRLAADLGSLVADLDRTYQSYLSNLAGVTDNRGKPLVAAAVAGHRAGARQAVGRLSALANQARQDSQVIATWLETEARSSRAKWTRRQQEVAQALLDAPSPTEFARRIERGATNAVLTDARLGTTAVRQASYGLCAALAGLLIFLIVDIYRRMMGPLQLKVMQQQALIQHQRKTAEFEELAAGVAHEIRNPLTTISARLYTVQRKLQEGTPEYKDALVIESEIERINFILKEFIQVTRPSPPNMELLNATPLLEDVSHLMAPQLQRQAVKVDVQAPSGARFYGDQQQIKQVLVNLIQNAAESMKHEGEVILRAREAKAPLKGAMKRVAIIEVEDNGPGIRPEVQGRLFEPFFSTKKEGTGLGLPISARIIDGHGGTLNFETQPDHGTIFRIVLPGYDGS